jgi:predicted DNA-binding antitoxin AbrB/MazE fold protein
MTVLGHVINGVIVPDKPIDLPEGAVVHIAVITSTAKLPKENGEEQTLSQKFLQYAGKATGLPPDLARNHDYYIHGTPKE